MIDNVSYHEGKTDVWVEFNWNGHEAGYSELDFSPNLWRLGYVILDSLKGILPVLTSKDVPGMGKGFECDCCTNDPELIDFLRPFIEKNIYGR